MLTPRRCAVGRRYIVVENDINARVLPVSIQTPLSIHGRTIANFICSNDIAGRRNFHKSSEINWSAYSTQHEHETGGGAWTLPRRIRNASNRLMKHRRNLLEFDFVISFLCIAFSHLPKVCTKYAVSRICVDVLYLPRTYQIWVETFLGAYSFSSSYSFFPVDRIQGKPSKLWPSRIARWSRYNCWATLVR